MYQTVIDHKQMYQMRFNEMQCRNITRTNTNDLSGQ